MKEEKKYKVNEIFESIQGEGINVGTMSAFVRFSKCNMACTFCDTEFASYTEMTAIEIYNAVKDNFKSKMISFTGGEPMLQLDAELLELFGLEYYIQVETNGSIAIPSNVVNYIHCLTVSPKDAKRWEQKIGHDLKFLVDKDDLDLLDEIYEDTDFTNYYLQPIDGDFLNENRQRCLELIKVHPEWKISMQIHKILNVR